jgi:hypothetical protein
MKHALIVLLASAMAAYGQVQYAFTNFAGWPGGSGNVDGTGSAARFYAPTGVAVDRAGTVYVADRYNSTIRKITPAGEVTTLAGSAGQQGSADGTGSAARFYWPNGVAVDNSGTVYVADTSNFTIRKITPAGEVTTLAGSVGQSGSADGAGTAARFNAPCGVAVDSEGNVCVADRDNHMIRKITPAGEVTTVAGAPGQWGSGSADGAGSAARFSWPYGLAVDTSDNVYVADTANHTIRKITPAGEVTTLAGTAGYIGSDDGTGSAARFYYPSGVTVDSADNVYVADSESQTIRKITPAGEVTTLAGSAREIGSDDGTGSAARFYGPSGVAVDGGGNVYVADNHTIRKITPAGVVTTLAGSPGKIGSADGTGSAAQFNFPAGVAVDGAGNVYVADVINHTIRKITPAGAVTTLAGRAGYSGSNDGTGLIEARFNNPQGVAVDSAGNVYVADTANSMIRKITPAGAVTTLAGSLRVCGGADGTGGAAQFCGPYGVSVDSGGNVYVADEQNATIRKMTPAGAVTTLAGSAGQFGNTDGIGSAARFDAPFDVAVDSSGNVYVAEGAFNRTIRKVTTTGVVTTLAGNAGQTGSNDGPGSAARFYGPLGVAVDGAGNVYVADTGNSAIRKITPAGEVTTLAGKAGQIGGVDGIGSAAQFSYPYGVAVDNAGNLYVADGNRITKGTPLFRFQTEAEALKVVNGSFQLRLTGPFGGIAIVETSANLQAWTPLQTNAMPSGVLDLSVPLGANQNQFFRARLAP